MQPALRVGLDFHPFALLILVKLNGVAQRVDNPVFFDAVFSIKHKLAAAITLAAGFRDHFNAKIRRAVDIFFPNDVQTIFADEKSVRLCGLIFREPDRDGCSQQLGQITFFPRISCRTFNTGGKG